MPKLSSGNSCDVLKMNKLIKEILVVKRVSYLSFPFVFPIMLSSYAILVTNLSHFVSFDFLKARKKKKKSKAYLK